MKSKKGDIPVTVLVIGILGICGLAILSFYLDDINVQNSISSVEVVEQAAVAIEKISFYGSEKVGLSEEEIDEIMQIVSDVQGRHILFEQGQISVRYNLP